MGFYLCERAGTNDGHCECVVTNGGICERAGTNDGGCVGTNDGQCV